MINFELMNKQLRALAEADASWLPVFANASALLWDCFPSINWAGFYIVNQGSLLLGPFQGKVACIRIPIGKGVCGTAVLEDATQRIDNVHLFQVISPVTALPIQNSSSLSTMTAKS